MKEKKKGNIIEILIVMAIIIFGVIYGGITLTKNWGKSKETISKENATGKLKKICKDININEVEPRKAPIDLGIKDVKDTIPNIDKYPAKVENTTDSYIEIFSTGEKAGNGKDGWLIDVANNFNESKFEINGKIISVKVREIASGLGMDYIISEKYLPDAYSPSNELWGEMIKANGKTIELCDDRMVGNVAGILISKEKYDELIKKYGAINLKNITQAVANGEINMGYTNPFASATGLNFLVSTLATFDSSNPLSEKAIDGFNEYQNNIPLIAYTTLQLRNSAESGILDGFIMEYQTYINSPELKTDYIFTPFGYRHDSPLYSVGNLSNEKKEILNKFIEFYKQDKYQELQLDCFKFETVPSRPLMKYDTVILVCTMAEAKYVYILSDNLYNKMGGFTIPEALHVKDKYKSTLEYLSYYSALIWHSNYSGEAQDYNIQGLNIFNDKGNRVDKFRLFMEYFGDTMEGYEFDDEEYEE